jgi:hypothetical protein
MQNKGVYAIGAKKLLTSWKRFGRYLMKSGPAFKAQWQPPVPFIHLNGL